MKLLYIAAPYRASTIVRIQQNICEAKLMAQYYWLKDYAVICPHLNTANFDGLLPDKTFLHGTMLMLSKCDSIALHPHWQSSSGSIAEFEYARDNDYEILYPIWEEILTTLTHFHGELL